MTDRPVTIARDGGVAVVTMNRPRRRNAIDAQLAHELLHALDAVAADDDVRCVVLTGAAGQFSVGGDLAAGAGGVSAEGAGDAESRTEGRHVMRAAELLHDMSKPSIAAIAGACAGAGLSLACATDIRLAAQSAIFSTAFARAGVSGDYGVTWTLPRIVGPGRARELLLFARRFEAAYAREIGLVSTVYPDDEFEHRVRSDASELAALPPLALAAIKANLAESETTSLAVHLDHEARRHFDTSRTADAAEAAAAFLGKRPPTFRSR